MMSDKALERVSVSYRHGYKDGYFKRERTYKVGPDETKPFADFDYEEGYKAGANDAKWSSQYRTD